MLIGIDARHFFYRQAGIYQYTRRLIDAFADMAEEAGGDFDYRIILGARDKATLLPPSLHMRRRSVWTPHHHRFEQLFLPLELATAGLDLLHSTDFIPPFRRNFKSVITVHDLGFMLFPETVTEDSKRYYGQIQRAVESAEGIISDSESTRRDMVQLLRVPEERVRVIYLGVDPSFKPIAERETVRRFCQKNGLPEEFVLFLGTLEPRKNVETLIEAWTILCREEALTPKLVIAGKKGWLYEQIYAAIEREGLADQVVFFDPAGPEDLVMLYNAARLFVFPSLYEGFGFPPLEAMACGLPVVCANVSSLPEIVGDAALQVEPKDASSLADAMFMVLTSEALHTDMRQRGLAQAAKFNWRKTAEETLEVYRGVGGAGTSVRQRK